MPLDVEPNQEFLEFLLGNGDIRKSNNFAVMFRLRLQYPGIFTKVMSDFEKAKSYRNTLDEKGRPITISWEEALTKFYLSNQYEGVTKENEDISKLLAGKGIEQSVFDTASGLRKEFKSKKIPEHLLGKSLKEESILESIERIRKQTEEELISGREMIEDLYSKQFTYEWLSKNDAHNSIMGLFCSCCATINSHFYGKDIAKASIIARDVQNLVVRDSNGEIVSKGTMYVNKEKGYAVINDFELNQLYRNHAHEFGEKGGRYSDKKDSPDEQKRELVFGAFQRGIKAFIEEYDRQNPDNPIKQINVGMGYNRLKAQVERFKKATSNLTVPAEYSFKDAEDEQYVLYQREQKQVDKGREEK